MVFARGFHSTSQHAGHTGTKRIGNLDSDTTSYGVYHPCVHVVLGTKFRREILTNVGTSADVEDEHKLSLRRRALGHRLEADGSGFGGHRHGSFFRLG